MSAELNSMITCQVLTNHTSHMLAVQQCPSLRNKKNVISYLDAIRHNLHQAQQAITMPEDNSDTEKNQQTLNRLPHFLLSHLDSGYTIPVEFENDIKKVSF